MLHLSAIANSEKYDFRCCYLYGEYGTGPRTPAPAPYLAKTCFLQPKKQAPCVHNRIAMSVFFGKRQRPLMNKSDGIYWGFPNKMI